MKNTWSPRVKVIYKPTAVEEFEFLLAQIGEIIYDWLANFDKNPNHKLSTRIESSKKKLTHGKMCQKGRDQDG